MSKKVVTFITTFLFFLSPNLFAHETRLNTSFTPSNFGYNVGINPSGESILAWDKKRGAVVYQLENNKWIEQDYFLVPDRSISSTWKKHNQVMEVKGSYAVFTAYPTTSLFVYKWDDGRKTWSFFKKINYDFPRPKFKLASNGRIAFYNENTGQIDVFSITLNRINYSIENPNDNASLNGDIAIDDSFVIASVNNGPTYIFNNGAFMAELPSATKVDINQSTSTAVIKSKKTGKIDIYKRDAALAQNGGWNQVDSIEDPDPLSPFASEIKLYDNILLISDYVNMDGEYGDNFGHGVIYQYNFDGEYWNYHTLYTPKNFTHNTSNYKFAMANNKLVIGDRKAYSTTPDSNTSGAAYVFSPNSQGLTNLQLEVIAPENTQLLGDIIPYKFVITNNSESVATNVVLQTDYNPYTGFYEIYNNSNFSLISATPEAGLCSNQGFDVNQISCAIGDIAPDEILEVIIEMRAEYVNQLDIFARTYSDQFDINYIDNTKLVPIYVSPSDIDSYAELISTGIYPIYSSDRSDEGSFAPALSADGTYVAFQSGDQLVEGALEKKNIYTHDRENTVLEISSISSSENSADGNSYEPSISNSGNLIVFYSAATNLVENDTNSKPDIFANNRITGETYRLTMSNYGIEANDDSNPATDISADEKYIVFSSKANNLTISDENNTCDIFIHDTQTRTLARINFEASEFSDLLELNNPSISGDGSLVSFSAKSSSSNLHSIYLWERDTQTISNIIDAQLLEDNSTSSAYYSEISDNGEFITYNLGSDIYLYNTVTKQTKLISAGLNHEKANGYSYTPTISASGQFVTFSSDATNLIESDTNSKRDVFVYDSETDTIKLASIGIGGFQGKGDSQFPSISADGTTIAYRSMAHNLVTDDINDVNDIFVTINPFVTKKPIDLQIAKTSSNYESGINEEVELTLNFSNQSTKDNAVASNVRISLTAPSNISLITAKSSIGECLINDQEISCLIESLEPSDKSELFTFIAIADKAGEYNLSANITSDEEDIDLTNNQIEITIKAIDKVDVYIAETAAKATSAARATSTIIDSNVYVGDKLNLNYSVGNYSDTTAKDITIEFELPESLSNISAYTNDGVCQTTGTTLICIIEKISPKSTIGISIEATPQEHGSFDIFAEALIEQYDSNTKNNYVTSEITILPKTDLEVSISTTPHIIFKGDAISYNIQVLNQGLTTATNSKLVDTVAEELTIESIQTSQGSCNKEGHIISCSLGDIASGESVNITINTLQKTNNKHYGFASLFKLKSRIRAYFWQDHKSIKKGFENLIKAHKEVIARWKAKHQPQKTSIINTATVSTSTPETDENNNSASITNEIAQKAYLRMLKIGRGKGIIEANSQSCTKFCKTTVAKGSQVTVKAISKPGSKFRFWAGACRGTNPVCTVDMNRKNKAAIAVFR
ncbi:MAG: hypothetical protein D6B28_10790 [Gammaproteobacteria bacterium]|nr:MAG: hypothetical protein D6B28_10790 [Gammaproteobacteria bacterium]